MLWVDKPKDFAQFCHHSEIANKLKKLVSSSDCTHMFFYGPPGSGKKVKVERKEWDFDIPHSANKLEINITTISSNYHVEIYPTELGYNDKYAIQAILKEMVKNKPIDQTKSLRIARSPKTLILNDADQLSKEAQQCLRRSMEKYSSLCRLFTCCEYFSGVIEHIRSRCVCIRVHAPSYHDIDMVLQTICLKEKIILPRQLSLRIAHFSDRNLRKAILTLEACKLLRFPFDKSTQIPLSDWESYINKIVNEILQEQTPKQLFLIRSRINELLIKCVPPRLLIRKLLHLVLRYLDGQTKHQTIKEAAFFEQRLHKGYRPIFHIEAFIAKIMYSHKRFLDRLLHSS